MDPLSPGDPTQRVVFMKAAQVGATEAGNNWIGFVIHQAPGPMLAVQPTVELAKRNSRQRIDPLIEESPELRERVKPARSRDAGNTMLSKEFAGRHPDHDRRELGRRPALDSGALHLPRRGRRLSGLGRRGRRSGHAGRGAVADLRAPAQGVPGLDADDPGAEPDRAGVRGERPAAVLRAVPALRRDAVAEVRAAALGEGPAGDGGLSLRGLRRGHRRAPQDGDAGSGRMARDRRRPPIPAPSAITSRRSIRRWAGWAGSGSRGTGRRRRARTRRSRRSATPCSARPGSRPARRRTGSGWRTGARRGAGHGARGRAVPDGRRRRAEGPDRGRCLGLGPRAGKLARRSRRDRGRARRSGLLAAADRPARPDMGACLRRSTDDRAAGDRHRLRDAARSMRWARQVASRRSRRSRGSKGSTARAR